MASADSVAFLGTGLMGAPIAVRLIRAGYPMRLWNRSPEKAQPLEAMGGRICESVAEAVRGARFVCLCLADATAVEEVVFGRGSMPKHLTPDSILIDFSTIGVIPTREFARRLAELSRAVWLDCPVSGGVTGAQAGSLVVFAGGDEAAIDRALPLLQQVAMRVNRMGSVGAGQAAKLCNQLIVATNLVAIAEAMALGESLGVDITQLPSALQGGFADSKPLQIFGPRMAAPDDPGPNVSHLRTMYKDTQTIKSAAAATVSALPLLDTVQELYGKLVAMGFGRDDLPALMKLYRR